MALDEIILLDGVECETLPEQAKVSTVMPDTTTQSSGIGLFPSLDTDSWVWRLLIYHFSKIEEDFYVLILILQTTITNKEGC